MREIFNDAEFNCPIFRPTETKFSARFIKVSDARGRPPQPSGPYGHGYSIPLIIKDRHLTIFYIGMNCVMYRLLLRKISSCFTLFINFAGIDGRGQT